MKENFFSRMKDTLKNSFSFSDDDEYYDDEDELYEDDEEPLEEPAQEAPQPPKFTSYDGYQPPAFESFAAQSQSAPREEAPKAAPKPKIRKGAGKIYAMPEVNKPPKMKITLFVLTDTDDARNVADCMIDRGIITICDMTKLETSQERRVLDFLDGVKYVCNSIIENISEHIYLVVPEAAELTGDFFSQVEY